MQLVTTHFASVYTACMSLFRIYVHSGLDRMYIYFMVIAQIRTQLDLEFSQLKG